MTRPTIDPSAITDETALEVRRLRVDLGFSWRAVAEEMHGKCDGITWSPPSCQPWGVALCDAAAEKLGEDPVLPPWNEEELS